MYLIIIYNYILVLNYIPEHSISEFMKWARKELFYLFSEIPSIPKSQRQFFYPSVCLSEHLINIPFCFQVLLSSTILLTYLLNHLHIFVEEYCH